MIKAVLFDMFETQVTIFQSPLYLSGQMAKDSGIPQSEFRTLWQSMDEDRLLGRVSFDQAIESVLKKCGCFSEDLLATIVKKRLDSKRECFKHLHPEIIPLFYELKKKSIKIGTVSNCFSEEAKVIRESALYSFYDSMCLSCEQGAKKPDLTIFKRCMTELSVIPEECIYIGDGGSCELEAASSLGMRALQAMWYVNAVNDHPTNRNTRFQVLERPFDLLEILQEYIY